ncbi:MAG: hypothetical protein LUD79_03640 [Oscillospiraceae bacterium]|nr:hypothetical protein [Oscillospiraceae bacterium]
MTEIISVRFKNGGKEYYFNPNGVQYKPGQSVIIETSRGVEFGECTKGNTMVDEMTLVSPLRPVLRPASPEDEKRLALNKQKEAEAFAICEKKIAEHNLDMKLVEVEYNFEGSKILFFFTSDGRVDFRELVWDLAAIFHTRIELRQIGVRDEAKLLGGLGICGRPFCCSAFLDDFQPVSIKMAKTQNLSLNPTKISGACGRLMCCLKYEQDAYEDALKRCPKVESLVETPDGVGTIRSVNLLRETTRVRLDSSPDTAEVYPCEELKVIRSGKGKRPEGYEIPEPQPKPERTHLRETAPIPQEKTPAEKAHPPKASRRSQAPAAATEPNTEAENPATRQKKNKNQARQKKPRKKTSPQGQTAPAEKPAPAPEGKQSQDSAGKKSGNQGQRRNNYHRNFHRKKSGENAQGENAVPKNPQS